MSQTIETIPLEYEEHHDCRKWYITLKVPFIRADHIPSDAVRFFPKCQKVKNPTLLNVQIEPCRVAVKIKENSKAEESYIFERLTQYPLLVAHCTYGVSDGKLMLKLTRENEEISWEEYMGRKDVEVYKSSSNLDEGCSESCGTLSISLKISNLEPIKKIFQRALGAENALIDFDVDEHHVSLEVRMLPLEQHKEVLFYECQTVYPLRVGNCQYEVKPSQINIRLNRVNKGVPWHKYFC